MAKISMIRNVDYTGATDVLHAFVTAEEKSYDGTNRRVRVKIIIHQVDWPYQRMFQYSITNNGVTKSYGSVSITGTLPVTIFDDDINVTVNNTYDYGTYPLSFTAKVFSDGKQDWVQIKSEGNSITIYELTKIDEIPIDSVADTVYGGNVSVKWTPVRENTYTRFMFSMGAWNDSTEFIQTEDKDQNTFDDYEIPMEVALQEPNAESGIMTVTMYTYSDSDGLYPVAAPSSSTFNVSFSQSSMPSISDCSGSIINSNETVAGWGIALAGFTNLGISAFVPDAGLYGSRVTKFNIAGSYQDYVISFNSTDASNIQKDEERGGYVLTYNSGAIQSSGDYTLNLSYTDSRGVTSSPILVTFGKDDSGADITSVHFEKYTTPIIKTAKASKTAKEDGTIKVQVAVDADYEPIGTLNKLSSFVYVNHDNDDVKMWEASDHGVKFTAVLSEAAWFVDASSYTLKLIITDSLGISAQKEIFLPSQVVMMDFKAGGDGLGIGKVCESPGLEVAMDTTFYGDVNILLEKDGRVSTIPLAEFIRDTMRIISSEMYGDSSPEELFETPQDGQLYFRRV